MIEAANPGSAEARADGCICPVMDNARGKGYLGGVKDEDGNTVFVMRADCPLHAIEFDDDTPSSGSNP
jgi:hypothetical protein